mmetsp:Transcript_34158/g.90254  ORF Transcript_34158/g.90254 Transcript_34158/m.90254 type:complete len:96 (+) Transcript_34158:243-530(+)
MIPYHHERAKSLQRIFRHAEALAEFNRVLMAQPKNAHAYFRRAFSLKALGRYEEAAGDLETAKAMSPDDPMLVVNYLQLHRTDAIELCRAGQELY